MKKYLILSATLFMFAYYRRNNYWRARISVFQAMPPYILFIYHHSYFSFPKLGFDL